MDAGEFCTGSIVQITKGDWVIIPVKLSAHLLLGESSWGVIKADICIYRAHHKIPRPACLSISVGLLYILAAFLFSKEHSFYLLHFCGLPTIGLCGSLRMQMEHWIFASMG